MKKDEVYIGPDGRPQLGRPRAREFKPRGGPQPVPYISPIWPPPGDPAVAHHCERGGPCDCARPRKPEDNMVRYNGRCAECGCEVGHSARCPAGW